MTPGDGVSGPLSEYSENGPLSPSPWVIPMGHFKETKKKPAETELKVNLENQILLRPGGKFQSNI